MFFQVTFSQKNDISLWIRQNGDFTQWRWLVFYQKFEASEKPFEKRTIFTDIFVTAELSDINKWLLKHVDLGLLFLDQVVSCGAKDLI